MTTFGFGASLALRQRRAPGAGFDFAGTMPTGAALTRASAGTRFDAGGVLTGAAANAARFDYDPATQALRGLLIEPSATNSALASETFDAAAWTVAGASVAANAGASPAGTTTADKLIESSGTGQHRAQQVVATTAGQTHSCSVYVKAVERPAIWLRLIGASTYVSAIFDLVQGVVVSASGPVAMTPGTGGWWRVSASGSGTYAGNGAAGMLLWGAQIEVGTVSSYVATTSAAASRAADAVTLDWGSRAVADGTPTVRYTFDDGSTQDMTTTVAGGTAAVPTTLARPRLRRAALV